MESSVKALPKIDVRAAVGLAQQYFQSLQDLLGYHIEDLRLEEVELSENKQVWLITLGFDRQLMDDPIRLQIAPQYTREYKIFKINAETGEIESMKIREL